MLSLFLPSQNKSLRPVRWFEVSLNFRTGVMAMCIFYGLGQRLGRRAEGRDTSDSTGPPIRQLFFR